MMYESEIEGILDKLNILEKAFDKIRIVDPVMKCTINLRDGKAENSHIQCFDLWEKNAACDNCVSLRAYREKDTFIKMEYTLTEIYIITAIALELSDRTVVIELVKKATNSLSININDKGSNAEIHAMIDSMNNIALKDSLTGIYNRRYIDEKLPVDLINANLTDYSISVIMVDIDFFKNVNDTYGHLTGDYTLKTFAGILQRSLKRDNDWVARYGGEEFLIVLPGANLEFAKDLAEYIRKKVENTIIECGDFKFSITSSFGVSAMTPKLGATVNDLIENADKKLYEAKHNGRNRVEA